MIIIPTETSKLLDELASEESFARVLTNEFLLQFHYNYNQWRTQPSVIRASKYLILPGIYFADIASVQALENARIMLKQGINKELVINYIPFMK